MVKEKTIEETYQKLSQREHVLRRSGVYIGDIKKNTEELWVINENNKMEKKFVEYSPGFMKIFDEVLSNATDHAIRDSTVNKIEVNYSKETGEISIYNNGSGVPVVLHKEQNMYVPELIFGHLLSGSNYDDSDTRTTVGVNGMGIKLTNIFSKKFVVETVDSENKKKFIQEFSNNMSDKTKPKITSAANTKSYTKIEFIPDYQRFSMEKLDDDTILLIKKRVYDCIANTKSHVNLYLNGEKIKGKSFTDYIKYYFDDSKIISEQNIQTIKGTEFMWEYAIVPSEHYEQVSFVNGNCTHLGGKHVDYILYQIINKIKDLLETKKKLKDVKPNFIKDKFCLFLKSTIINPSFNSQTKETLTTQVKDFGCKVEVTENFINKIYKSSIIDEIVEFCKLKESSNLAKHSVSGDTPLLLKDKNNKIIIKTIEKITEIFTTTENNNDYGKSDYKVWTEDGWTDIIHIMRHKSSKQMYRILTHTGFVDVTEDHSLLTDKIEEISPKNCKIDDNLLHSFPEFIDNVYHLKLNYKEMKSVELQDYAKYLKIPYYRASKHKLLLLIENKHNEYNKLLKIDINYDNSIDLDESWVMGLFWADGTAGFYTDKKGYNLYNLIINNVNKEFLIKAQKILEEKYNENTTIYKLERDVTRQTIYQLRINGNTKIKYIVSKYIDLFYYGKNYKTKYGYKYVPMEILNSKRHIRENFLRGVYCGDGSGHNIDSKGTKRISIDSKISSQGIYYLAKSLGYFVSIQCRQDKPNIFDLYLGKYYYIKHPDKIKKIIKLGYTNEYVYDLETKNHHFQAGIGRMIVHNSDGKKVSKVYIPKLEDAIYAGTVKSDQCTLILTEGDSAKTFAMWGRAIIGPEKYGVFPLKGKLLNVRDATISQLINNEEINNIKHILGLKEKKVYTDTKELRYSKIMLLTDADVDGSHIKALVMNFIHCGWPSLLKIKPNFIQTLKTPIVIANKGKNTKEFFTEQDYHLWLNSNNTKGYKINYYKGLGTSTKEDAKKLFKRFDELIVNYYHKDDKCDESILLAFDKDKNNKVKIKDKDTDTDSSDIVHVNCTDRRKAWLANFDKDIYIDVKENIVSYQDLINKELIFFSIYDNTRSIPSICDGLKPGQRKILYYMLHNNVNVSMKVAQLSGKISSDTSYHHGEASLEGTIVGLAQDFVGTNNINLLYPDGNHGSRLLGGKDAASARYIKTRLSDITPLIFNKLDFGLLNLLQDDGIQIEPEWYLPIIPMVLVNGCDGIGTGYSTSIPPYNPKNLINNILRVMDDKDPLPLIPFYRNFNGEIVKDSSKENTFITKGKYIRLSDTQIKVTELPVGCWVTTYKEFLESLVVTNSKKDLKSKKKFALKFIENRTADEDDAIDFMIEFTEKSTLDDLIKSNTLEKELKLTKSVNTNNMHVFSENLILTKYTDPNDILLDWYDQRLEYYQKRKDYLTKKYKDELIILNSKIRFVNGYINKDFDINKKSKEFITNLLKEQNYPDQDGSYDYLLNLPIYSFTLERIEALNKQVQNKQAELDYIKNKTDKDLWKVDLEELNKYL